MTSAEPSEIPARLQAIERLYEDGRVYDAFVLGQSFGPLTRWPGVAGLVLAGRIAMNLGAARLGRQLHVRAHRADPRDPRATYYYARAVLERRGPLAVIDLCQRVGNLPDAPPDVRADWLSFRATIAAIYRDFDTADDLLDESERLAPDRPWTQIERAGVCEASDRFDRALSAARRSLELKPWFRVGVQTVAHLLQVRDSDAEALDLLTEGVDRIQSVPLVLQLASLQDHLRLHADAMRTLSQLDPLMPVREKRFEKSIAGLRSNIAYHGGDIDGAIAAAEATGDEFLKTVAAKLREQAAAGRVRPRVVLKLPFVRQHHMTCAPATLTAVSRYWDRPADHLGLVDAICYDGTPLFSQRNWARTNGWFTREFRFTPDAAVALIDRGIPFTLATVSTDNSHLQAVIGYDPTRGTILCRDPYQYYETEFSADLLARYNAAFGPHCMVMLPGSRAHLLDGVALPDADELDLMHEVEKSLAVHDRAAASAAREKLSSTVPGHRLAFQADRAVAAYDRDQTASLAALDGLIALYPDDKPLQLSRVYALRALDRRDDVVAQLAAACARSDAEPVFLHLYAEELRAEQGDTAVVTGLLAKALRRRPAHAASLATMGHVRWGQRRQAEATDLYFLAACVDDKNEYPWQTYFIASRHQGQSDKAVRLLERRFDRSGRRSSQPARTLCWAYEQLDRVADAMAVLDRARVMRPDDGDLLLFAADLYGRRADFAKAREMLAAATGKTRENARLRSAAWIAEYTGNAVEALDLWSRVLVTEPMADDAHNQVARLTAETQSPEAGDKYFEDVCDRFPHDTNLRQSRIVWLRRVGAEAVAAAARGLIDRRPGNVWARVELSLALTKTGDTAGALEQAGAALAISPNAHNAHHAAGLAMERLGRVEEAREHFRQAVRSSVNYSVASDAVIASYADRSGQREALDFIRGQLTDQGLIGDGLLTYAERAVHVVPDDELAGVLESLNRSRPDAWQTWSARVRFESAVNRLDDAERTALGAVERFSLLPRTWLDLSTVHEFRGNRDGQIESLRRGLELSPAWSGASRRLSRALQKAGRPDEALSTMERAVARDPLDGENQEALSNLLRAAGRKVEAVAAGRRAVLLNPWLSGMWESLGTWAAEDGSPGHVVELARDVCRRRGGEAIAWTVLARALSGPATLDERLAAVDKAIALAATTSDPHDLKACLLVEAGRFDDAVAACDPPAFKGRPPVELRGRVAWVLDARKDRAGAVGHMRAVLGDDPAYYWGWRQLIRWLSEAKDDAAYLEAATDMVRAFPHDVVARNNLAHAQLAVRDRAAAKATLVHSRALFPDNPYVLGKLFTVQLEDADFDDAEVTLELIGRHRPADEAAMAAVRLAAATNDRARAGPALAAVCRSVGADVSDAVEALDKAGMADTVGRVLGEVVAAAGDVAPAVVDVWVRRLTAAKKWKPAVVVVDRFPDDTPQYVAAAVACIEGLAAAKLAGSVTRFVARRRSSIRKHTRAWGSVGFAYMTLETAKPCVTWLADWNDRPDALPWMLVNLVTALRRLNRDDEANRAGRHAMTLADDGTHLKHAVWLALDDVLAGRSGEHGARLTAPATAKLDNHYPYLIQVYRALALLTGPAGPDAKQKSTAARRALDAAFNRVRAWKKTTRARPAVPAGRRPGGGVSSLGRQPGLVRVHGRVEPDADSVTLRLDIVGASSGSGRRKRLRRTERSSMSPGRSWNG